MAIDLSLRAGIWRLALADVPGYCDQCRRLTETVAASLREIREEGTPTCFVRDSIGNEFLRKGIRELRERNLPVVAKVLRRTARVPGWRSMV